ncbi:F-box/kelch-repeat protein At3g06240-like [Papaver somniferum]|uniref:F-box/kelch-repeat protein At3g06240-like n=1 Tax=Papaver somniferum TaxID=3469 RepID=UPI000E6FC2C5|nr:F-box/kelch-repeat protein At3g06240-like [Papaver somniferum]
MSSVPEDVYLEILLRVPVKSTFTCKCVCKTWLSIISNPNFVNQHVNVTAQRNNNLLMLKGRTDDCVDVLLSVGCDSLVSEINDDDVVVQDCPYKPVRYMDLMGSCNGLVCVWSSGRKLYCIWNPFTREFKELPKSPIKYDEKDVSLHVFGYDCKNDDYKLINVVDHSSLVHVYTLRSNSWRRGKAMPYRFSRQGMPYSFSRQGSGVLVNGAWHWVGSKRDNGDSKLIIPLDIKDVKFQELPLSKEVFKNNDLSMTIGALRERLCAIFDVGVGFEVWMMKEYGVRESWTKCYHISHDKIKNNHCFRLLCSLRNSEILLLSHDTLVSYDPKDGSARQHNINGVKNFHDKVDYFESLVSLGSGKYVGVQDRKEVYWSDAEG